MVGPRERPSRVHLPLPEGAGRGEVRVKKTYTPPTALRVDRATRRIKAYSIGNTVEISYPVTYTQSTQQQQQQ